MSAATLPPLGASASFSVLGQTLITGISTISGDVGMNSSGANITALTTPNVAGTIYATNLSAPSEGILLPAVQADALAAYTTNIPGQAIEGTPIVGGVLDAVTRGPGVYDLGAGTLSGGVLTLDGPGIYIFRTTTTLVSSGSINFINGARACDLFWRVGSAATINGTSFAGTILAGTGIHFGSNVTLDGRALAIGGDVTMLNNTISGPTCAVPPVSNTGIGGVYSMPWVMPIIDVVKNATPTFLPAGPGTVVYDYIVSNIGATAINTVTVADDKCSPVIYLSGDTNNDAILNRTEIWKYSCTSTLAVTTTNIVTATGRAFFYTTTDTASATVTVGTTTAPVASTTPIVVAATSTVVIPSLPNAGVTPSDKAGSWTAIGILIGSIALAFTSRKQFVKAINVRQ